MIFSTKSTIFVLITSLPVRMCTVALRITLVVYYPRQMAAILPSIQKVFAVPRQHLTII